MAPHVTPISSPHVGEGSDLPPVAVATQIFPIDKRPLTEFERKIVQALYQDSAGESINALCKRVYGSKYRKTFDWIVEALQLPQPEPAAQIGLTMADGPEGA